MVAPTRSKLRKSSVKARAGRGPESEKAVYMVPLQKILSNDTIE